MNRVLNLLLAFTLLACSTEDVQSDRTANSTSSSSATPAEDSFGGTIQLDRDSSVTVSEAMTNPRLQGREVLVRGTINDVCQQKGCWLVVTDGVEEMRVTFKDYAFFVPKDSDGRHVLIEGVVSQQEISEGAAKHYASESRNADSASVAKIKGAQKIVTMEASAVAIAHES